MELAVAKSSKDDIERFNSMVKGASAEQVGLLVAMAAHYKNSLAKEGVDLLHPMVAEEKDPLVALKITRLITSAQRGDPANATGWMVWLHTLRAANTPEIRFQGRLLWRELSRGFPYVEAAADDLAQVMNFQLDINDYDMVPEGLEDDGR
ncbi:MAG: hypothetical protein HY245_04940 [Rhizobiales bacterium]|nr:hypothetical protein [Hyphomicrobiales bacterium]MBI3672760.1 hypothetical protein [Hyphomicrobiales bacterium]